MQSKALIRNIENLSTTLNPNQLAAFLDIMDELSLLLDKAQRQADKAELQLQIQQQQDEPRASMH